MFSLTRNAIFPILVSLYPLTLIISNITAFKFNFILAIILLILSINTELRTFKFAAIIAFALSFIFVKFGIYGDYSIKEMIVLLFGPLLFNRFVFDFDNLSTHERNVLFYTVSMIGFIVSFFIILQFFDIIPMTLGQMEFLNIVGMNVFGEYDLSFRPSAYFYHPYDTSLAIVPILAFSVIWISRRLSFHSLLLFSVVVMAVYSLQLKVLYGFVLFIFLFSFFLRNFKIKKIYFFCLALLLTILVLYFSVGDYSREEVSYSAGRLIIWKFNFEEFFGDFTILKSLFGLSENPLESNMSWSNDEFFSMHNLYMFLIINTGFLFTVIFIYLKQSTLNKSSLVDFCIAIMMFTFAFTGDLMVFTSYWICISCLYVISSRFGLNVVEKKSFN